MDRLPLGQEVVLDGQCPKTPPIKIKGIEDGELAAFGVNGHVVDVRRGRMGFEKIIECDRFDSVLNGSPASPRGQGRYPRQFGAGMFRESDRPPPKGYGVRAPDTPCVNMAVSVFPECGMPDASRLGHNSGPTEGLFQKPCIAEAHAIGGPELDKVAAVLTVIHGQGEEILLDLGFRVIKIGHKGNPVLLLGCPDDFQGPVCRLIPFPFFHHRPSLQGPVWKFHNNESMV